MKILNAMQLQAGATADYTKSYTLIQPVQFLRRKDKDEAWYAWNIDWIESQGLNQIREKSKRLTKNYKLLNGIIDKSDYILEEDNEMAEMIDILTRQDETAYDLKFFPIIPNVANVLIGEFLKRNDKILYKSVDENSYNLMIEQKREMIEANLLSYGEQKMMQTLQNMGVDMESEEGHEYAKQLLSEENIKSLPEIEEFFKKDYRALCEEWATHQHNIDMERFRISELEKIAFTDMLATDSEYWHFKMNEDDYDIEVWNPILTAHHKSPNERYISNSTWVYHCDLKSIADVVNDYGYLMSEEQLSSLERIYPIKGANYIMPGVQNDGSFYDASQTHKWNTDGPSLGMRQFMTARDYAGTDVIEDISSLLFNSGNAYNPSTENLLRVGTVYWMGQRMVGHLTSIDKEGMLYDMIVDENYKVTEKPIYNNTVLKEKSRKTLVYGEHIDWIWINEAYGGIKIGQNRPSYYGMQGLETMYIKTGPCKFQFKGDFTTYGAKLPVEGTQFSERNTMPMSLVDKMKPWQIGYNLVNNQISDILIDELGTVILLDQNALPKHSMGEDWGKNNFSKAYVAMKNFQILPLDSSIANTENSLAFQHYQQLDLSQTNRLISRINIANYYRQQAFESIGISPQRAANINSQETATGIEQAINMSYTQTDIYFVQHSEYLMPRVHEMRTNLAQYYHSTKPSVRLQYMTTMDESINFTINGTDLLLADLNVYITTSIKNRQIVEQIRSLALNNNTSGATIYDLGTIAAADSIAEINTAMKRVDEKLQQRLMREQQEKERLLQIEQSELNKRLEAELMFKAEEAALDREKDIRVAEIRAAGYAAMQDKNNNERNDYIDTLEYLDERNIKEQEVGLKREALLNKQITEDKKLDIKNKELEIRERIANKQLQIAQTNKNQYDKKPKKK